MAVSGRRVKLTEWGRGPAVVLLHGLTGSRAYLLPYAERLGRTHHVIAVDLPGHGGSDALEPFSFSEAARVMAHAVARAGAERPVVFGHSFGAPLAVAWAAERPVAGVVACWPVGMVPLELRRAGYVLPFHRALALTEPAWGAAAVRLAPSRRVIFGWFVGMAGLDGLEPAMGRQMLRDSGRAAHVVPSVLGPLAELDLPGLAAAVSAPALVLWGDRDSGGWQSGPPLVAAMRATEVVLPGVGHMPMLEAPYAFTKEMGRFLSATVPP